MCARACVCVYWMLSLFLTRTVSGRLRVRGQSGGTFPLHLGDSFYLPGTLTGKTASSDAHNHTHNHTHTWIILSVREPSHTRACLVLTLSFPVPWVCVFVCLNIFDCTLCAHLSSATLVGLVLLSLSLSFSLSHPPSLPLQVLTSVDCLWPLVLWMLSPAILPRCINNNSNYWSSNQSVAPAHWACLGEQIDRHLKSHIDCREGEKHQGGWQDR